MRHGSLFSGIGGFDLAAEWMGWENVFHCEWMEFPRKVLDYHFPNADSHIDICKTDFKKYANTIDILTGGFPCQPFSLAGKRKGTDDERYLWGEMLRAIQEIKPRFVIAENVFGITNIDGGLVFQQVCLDLEDQGYEVQPFIIPACAKNAPHRRDRCWFIATNTNCNDGRSTDRKGGCQESKANGEGQQSIHSWIGATSNEGNASDTNGDGFIKGRGYDGIGKNADGSNTSVKWSTNSKDIDGCGSNGILEEQSRIGSRVSQQTNVEENQTTTSRRVCGVDETNECKGTIRKNWIIIDKSRALVQERQSRFFASINRGLANDKTPFSELANLGFSIDISRINSMEWNATNTYGNGLNERNCNDEVNTSQGGEYALGHIESGNGNGIVANPRRIGGISRGQNIQSKQSRWEGIVFNGRERNVANSSRSRQQTLNTQNAIVGQQSTTETFSGNTTQPIYSGTEWQSFPTQSPICGGDDGLPTELDGITFSKWRAESIKGYGNAIVPQIAHQLFQIINDL